jgi:hypothetical protein
MLIAPLFVSARMRKGIGGNGALLAWGRAASQYQRRVRRHLIRPDVSLHKALSQRERKA